MSDIIKNKIPRFVRSMLLLLWAVIQLFPVYWLFTFSLKSNREIFGENVIGLPREWLWENYEKALTVGHMLKYFMNSLIIAGGSILVTTVAALMAAYALGRLIWKGRNLANALFMLGLTIPIHAAMLPDHEEYETFEYVPVADSALCGIFTGDGHSCVGQFSSVDTGGAGRVGMY